MGEKISIELTSIQATLLQLAIADALVKNRDERNKYEFGGERPHFAYNFYHQRIEEYIEISSKITFAEENKDDTQT